MQVSDSIFQTPWRWKRIAPLITGAVVQANVREFRDSLLQGQPSQRRSACALFDHDRWTDAFRQQVQPMAAHVDEPAQGREADEIAASGPFFINGPNGQQQKYNGERAPQKHMI